MALSNGGADAPVRWAPSNSFRNHILTGQNREQGTNRPGRGPLGSRDPGLDARVTVESGVLVEQADEFQRKQRISGTTVTVLNDYRADALRDGGYARARVDAGNRVVDSVPGARVDHSSLTGSDDRDRRGCSPR